jgi:quinol monooxygenase YgiN
MPDLDVVAVLKAKPGSEQIVRAALRDLVEPTRGEAGCVSYELFDSLVDPTTFVTVERWLSQADLDAHMSTPHVAQALTVAGEHFDGIPGIHPLSPVA